MDDLRGGSGYWCPDCGTVLAAGQGACPTCGLDYTSQGARDTERANAELHRIRATIEQLTGQQHQWLDYRNDVLRIAHRDVRGPDASPVSGPRASTAREQEAGASLVTGAGDPAQVAPPEDPDAPFSSPAVSGAPFSSPTMQQFPSPSPQTARQHAPAQPAPTQPTSPSSAMRPAAKLTAPVLLGIAGAALFILAGIVFVAASWSVYVPEVRMAILVAFASAFAWLAWAATRHNFGAVGGALGVVSAAFVGVGVYALTAGTSGPAPYTAAIAVLVAAFAGLGLTRLKIKAVGEVASAAVIFAIEAGAIEGAVRSSNAAVGMAIYAMAATLGGGAILASRRIWRPGGQRTTATYGGTAVVFVAALVAVLAPLSAQRVDGFALTAFIASVAACAGIASWRPVWGAGTLTGILTIGAVTAASMWRLTAGQLTVVGGLAALAVAIGLGRAPRAWRTPGLWGLLPGFTGGALAMLPPAIDGVPRALSGLDLYGDGSAFEVGALRWFACALFLGAAVPLVCSRWDPPALAGSAWAHTAAFAFATGTVFLGLDAAYVAADGAAGAGTALLSAAAIQWFCAPLWGTKRINFARALAVGLATFGGLHGAAVVVEAADSTAHLLWGSLAIVVSLVGLAGAAIRLRYPVGEWSLVAVVGVSAFTWHFSTSFGNVAVAAAVASLLIAVACMRLPIDRVSRLLLGCLPAYMVAGIAVTGGAVVAVAVSVRDHSAGAFAGYGWAMVLSCCIVVAGPVAAILARRVGFSSPLGMTRVVTGLGMLALVPMVVARLQQALADTSSLAPTVADALAPALTVGVGAAAYGLVAWVPWLRPARRWVGIGVVTLASLHGVVGLGRLTLDVAEVRWAVGAVLVAAGVLGIAARWFPAVALAPAIFLSTLVAPAALSPHHGELALAVAAILTAAVAWVASRSRGVVRSAALFGGLGVMFVAFIAGLVALGASVVAFGQTWAGEDVGWRPWMLVAIVAVTAAVLAWKPVRVVAGATVAVALVVMAGCVPGPIGWIVLAAIGASSTEVAARWSRRLGLHPLVPLAVCLAAVAWSGGASSTVAVTLGTVALASIWTAMRAESGGIRTVALVLAPLAGSVAVFLALMSWNVDSGIAAAIATGTALTMPLVAVAAGLDARRLVAVWILGFASVVGPISTGDLGLAGFVVVLDCAAWFTVSTLGVRWGRWVALGGLSVATMLLAADVGIGTLEVYTAVPALTMIVVGLWWLKRDPRIRTYFALAPGLGAALVPSYAALALHPEVFARTLALVGAALVLALVGVALRWFAPLLATAVTAVVVALSQATADESLLPLWMSVSIIGAVLFSLALLAERIKAMR